MHEIHLAKGSETSSLFSTRTTTSSQAVVNTSSTKAAQVALGITGSVTATTSCFYFSKYNSIEDNTLAPLAGCGIVIGVILMLISISPAGFARGMSRLLEAKPHTATFFPGPGDRYNGTEPQKPHS